MITAWHSNPTIRAFRDMHNEYHGVVEDVETQVDKVVSNAFKMHIDFGNEEEGEQAYNNAEYEAKTDAVSVVSNMKMCFRDIFDGITQFLDAVATADDDELIEAITEEKEIYNYIEEPSIILQGAYAALYKL